MEINTIDFLGAYEFNVVEIFTIGINLILIFTILLLFFICNKKVNQHTRTLNNCDDMLIKIIIMRNADKSVMKMKNICYGLVLISILINSVFMFTNGLEAARSFMISNGSDRFVRYYLKYALCSSLFTLIIILLDVILFYIIDKKLEGFNKNIKKASSSKVE